MDLSIHLLGKPRLERAGRPAPGPRGHKSWGLLTYLLLAETPPTREHLASLLFSEADDPSATLRWNLSELRRAFDDPGLVAGDPLRLELPPGTVVDALLQQSDSRADVLRLPGLGRSLLEGMQFDSCAAFEIWLLMQRRHLDAAAEAALHEEALVRLGAGDAKGAAQVAGHLVALNPLEENYQALFIRSLAAAGDGIEAARQVARCTELFRRELDVEPSPAVAAAARTVTASPTSGPVTGKAAARAQLEAGQAAIGAGALDAGLDCLRRAIVEARAAADAELQGRALVALGSALVHAARGRDEEGVSALHEALALTTGRHSSSIPTAAAREIGYVEFLRGRYARASAWAAQALRLAPDDEERGRIRCLQGSILSDTAHYDAALEELRAAAALNEASGDARQLAYTLSMLGRAQLLLGEVGAAADALDSSIDVARAENWTAFVSWPEALRGDVDFLAGDIDAASERYEYAFALGCQLGDPCWEGIGARGLGVVAAARGDIGRAVEWLTDAQQRCTRLPDAYLWVHAYTLDALCSLAVEHGLPNARVWIEELATLAGRTEMREFTKRVQRAVGPLTPQWSLAGTPPTANYDAF